MAPRLHVIASLMVDRVARVSRLPQPGETVTARAQSTFPGGKGANQAAAAARCGARVRACGRTGADGRFIVDALSAAGVDASAVRTDDPVAGNAFVLVADGGENAIVIAPESNARLDPADVATFLSAAAPGDLLLVQNECAGLRQALAAARAGGLRAWFNAAPADDGLRALDLSSLDGLFVNETEAEALTGERDPSRALDALAARLPAATVVVTLGAAGALLRAPGLHAAHAGYRVRAVDTVGCGDAFVGAFLAAIVAGHGHEAALAWGNAAGALAARRPGAMPSLPSQAEVAALAALPAGSEAPAAA
jgi:ribokinase